jgi:hypothetical protein
MHFLQNSALNMHYSAVFRALTPQSLTQLFTTGQYSSSNPPILEVTKAHPRKLRVDRTEKKLSLPTGRDLLRRRGIEKGDPS